VKYGVLGTGMVGQAISNRLAELEHEVMIGTRDPSRIGDRLASRNDAIRVGTFAESATFGKIVFNATNGAGSLEALSLAGASSLEGKVLVDVSNPLDFSKGNPPSLFVSSTDSLGEQIQRTFPNVKVVKALNTVTAAIMVDPQKVAGGDHDMFVCGNDAGAKDAVKATLREFGWSRLTDLGDITAGRGMEMYLPIWLRLWGAQGTGMFNIKVMK
jgi:predicted dinucleotide-binding enzyme